MYSSILSSTCITVNTDLMLWAKVDALVPSAQGSKTWNQCRQPWAIDLKLAFKIFDLGMFREGGDGLTAWVYFLVVFLVFFFSLFSFPFHFFCLPSQEQEKVNWLAALLSVKSPRPDQEGKVFRTRYMPCLYGSWVNGIHFVCMRIHLALNSVLGGAQISWRRTKSSFLPRFWDTLN